MKKRLHKIKTKIMATWSLIRAKRFILVYVDKEDTKRGMNATCHYYEVNYTLANYVLDADCEFYDEVTDSIDEEITKHHIEETIKEALK